MRAVDWWEDPGSANANESAINLNLASGASIQKWTLTSLGGGYYQITNSFDNLVLDDPAFSSAPGIVLDQWASKSGDNQKWLLTPPGSGYILTSDSSGLVVDPNGNTSGSSLQQSTAKGAASQVWTMH